MKRFMLALLFAIGLSGFVSAFNPPDEGMWLPMFIERLNYVDMEEMGLQLTPEELYSINNSSLKDAIVGLSGGGVGGFFCTGEIVSDKGLMFTNHHCGYNHIQKLSTPENNYLEDGFWAYSLEEELPAKGLSASFLKRMENVTDSILPFLSDTMSEADRSAKVKEISNRMEERASEDETYNAVVKAFYDGNEYYMFVYETYNDVRFVGAPPSSIGKYGGDTDNWMWPRHTGDFSIFRVYASPDGEPADYAEENVPMKPKHHLPVSLEGKDLGEFAMIWGFPGGTNRYMTSYGIDYNVNDFYPIIIEVFGAKLDIWKEYMDKDPQVKLEYASKYASAANGWKYYIGLNKGVKNLNVYERKKKLEDQFIDWYMQDTEREKEYGKALPIIREGYEKMKEFYKPFFYANFAGYGGAEIIPFAAQINSVYKMMEDKKKRKQNKEAIKEAAKQLIPVANEFFQKYDPAMDEKVFTKMMELYTQNVSTSEWPEFLLLAYNDMNGDMKAYGDYVFNQSIIPNKDALLAFLEDPKFDDIKNDPVLQAYEGFYSQLGQYGRKYQAANTEINKGDRIFVRGLRKMNPDKVFYPDANSSMRVTYGSVEDYYPADAVHYDYYTTLAGVMEKEDPESDEFIVDEKLKQLYASKDYGIYGQDGEMIVAFLTTNGITGGNSGSPVMNGKVELIGIAFDGNWEAMSGDLAFETELQRCINVDIRYVLFIIDKFAGAKNLIEELTIIKAAPKMQGAAEKAELGKAVEVEN
ncbi:MAG: S46 family peptidase [Bacteroidales bacterium]|nr:S46 family peptidase [Bacteroidales bacterium]